MTTLMVHVTKRLGQTPKIKWGSERSRVQYREQLLPYGERSSSTGLPSPWHTMFGNVGPHTVTIHPNLHRHETWTRVLHVEISHRERPRGVDEQFRRDHRCTRGVVRVTPPELRLPPSTFASIPARPRWANKDGLIANVPAAVKRTAAVTRLRRHPADANDRRNDNLST
jgi:hypothetical protein